MTVPFLCVTGLRNTQLEELVANLGEPRYRAGQLQRWLYRGLAKTFDEMADLPKHLRQKLAQNGRLHSLTPVHKVVGGDGTVKILFTLADGKNIESTLMPYPSARNRRRYTVCLSTQVGCTCFVGSPQPYGPKVTGDGTGGAIAVYEDIKGSNQHDFYVQKISPGGDILWGEKGILIGSGYKYWDSFHDLHIVSDGYGGALVSWLASVSTEQRTYATYVVRVDAEGDILWKKEVRAVDHMISDGAGGAIIATDYSYDERTLFIIKIDSDGKFPWGEDGVFTRREGYRDHSLGLTNDDNGGAIFIWQERKGEPGKRVTYILAQRIDAGGNISWGQDGILLYTPSEKVSAEEPRITKDGSGGTIAVWMQVPEGKIEEGSPEALLFDICVQRVDAQGKVLWAEGGVPLGITKGGGECPTNPLIVNDGAGSAIVIWEDLRKGLMSMYAQKIDADGNIKWQPGGEEVCYIETKASFWPRMAVSDGSGGAIVTFGIRVQRIDANGRTMWPDDGILFTDGGTHDLAYDGHGGAVLAWGSGKSMFKSERSYVQRIDSEGKLLWGAEGIRLNP